MRAERPPLSLQPASSAHRWPRKAGHWDPFLVALKLVAPAGQPRFPSGAVPLIASLEPWKTHGFRLIIQLARARGVEPPTSELRPVL